MDTESQMLIAKLVLIAVKFVLIVGVFSFTIMSMVESDSGAKK